MAERTNKLVPKIRFKGFSDEWKEKTLGELCRIGDIDHRMPKSVTNGIPYVMTGDFAGVNEINFKNSKQISNDDYEQLSQKIKPEAGDILFARYASVGAVRYVRTHRKFLVSYSCAILKQNNSFIGEYLFYYLQSNGAQHQIKLEVNAGSQGNVGIDSLKNLSAPFPKTEEQNKIALSLSTIDLMIELHQRKHEKLVTLKKAMLKKMFPQNGATTPEIRFKGFSEPWEEKNIEDVADRHDNLRVPISAANRVPGNTPYYGANGIQDYVKGYTHDGEFILVAEDGANDLKSYPVQYVNGRIWVNNHAHVLQARDEIADNRFLKYAFSQLNIEPFLVGGGRSKLNAETMMKIEVRVPLNIKEQQKIGSYFRQLDELIEQHGIQLTKLKQIKSSCLEKMFV